MGQDSYFLRKKVEFRSGILLQSMTTSLYFPNFSHQVVVNCFSDWRVVSELREIDEQIRFLEGIKMEASHDFAKTVGMLRRYDTRIIHNLMDHPCWEPLPSKFQEIDGFVKMALVMCGFPPLDTSEIGRYVFKDDEIPQEKIIAINVLLEVKYGLRLKLE